MLDASAIARVDRSGMLAYVRSLPDQLRRGYRAGGTVDLGSARRVAFAGVGGSAIAADVYCGFARDRSDVPLEVVRGYEPPAYLGEDDAFVAVSYSGETEETLSAAQIALRKGCRVATISSGGRLRALAEAHNLPRVEVPPNLPPRAAFGHLFGAVAGLARGWTFRDVRDELEPAAAHLERLRTRYDAEVGATRNPAKSIAGWVRGRTAVVYGGPAYAPVAARWKAQLNENAKVHAFAGALPEADHNEVVAWAGDAAARRFAPILLRDREELPELRRQIDATRGLLRRRARVREVEDDGETLLARLLGTVLLGDYASVYLAVLLGRDPTPTTAIAALKRKLAR